MKKALLALFAAVVFVGAIAPEAQAQPRHRRCWYEHHHRHCRWE